MKADRVCLDTGVFTLHFGNDSQIRQTMNSILKGNLEAHTCELNLAEHYYKTCEKSGRDVAEVTTNAIRRTPIEIHPADESLTSKAASLKCRYRGKISLVDSYILAISKERNCRVITTDPIFREINVVPTTQLEVP